MFSKPVDYFEFPTNLGLRRKTEEKPPGTDRLPDWLAAQGLYKSLKASTVFRLEPPTYEMSFDRRTGILNQEKIRRYAKKQAELVQEKLDSDHFSIFLGGDCSILIGNGLALKQKGRYGLFFLDGHTDYTTPELSQTKAVAGMDLALATGFGTDVLANIDGCSPYFYENTVFCIGNREYDADYTAAIINSGIRYADLAALRKIGPLTIVEQFLQMVFEEQLDGFFIHLDVDVLNDAVMPAVDSRQKDGLSYRELTALLKPLINHEKAVGMEVTVLDPDLDPEGSYTQEFIHHFSSLFV